MATSADRDDRDEDEDEKDEAEAEAAPQKKDAKAGAAKPGAKASAKPAAKASADEAEEEEEDEEGGEDEEEDEEEADEKPATKPASKDSGARSGSKSSGPRARGPGASRARPAPAAGGGSLGKSVLLFFVIVIGLGLGFALLGREPNPEQSKPKWTQGQVVDVEVTLVKTDRQDLACAAADAIGGKHCAFEAPSKPWSKGGDPNDDKTLLKPYTTLDRMQFVAAGLWSDPAMAPDKLPATRFAVKCKFKVEGTIKSVAVRWEQTGQWFPNNEWYAGSISDCKMSP